MEKIIYSPEELKALRSNPNVAKCSSRSITYSQEFKLRAVKQYHEEGLGPTEIFLKAGFDLNAIGRSKPKSCLKDWRNIYKSKGQNELLQENRGKQGGRKPKAPESEDPDYLKAKIAYLEAENDFLRKLKTKPKV
jgi:transposase-like protein